MILLYIPDKIRRLKATKLQFLERNIGMQEWMDMKPRKDICVEDNYFNGNELMNGDNQVMRL